MKVLVCGARDWANWDRVKWRLARLPAGTEIIEGGAPGADLMAARFAAENGLPLTQIDARWDLYGRAAGPIRNRAMLDLLPGLVIAFHNDLKKSRGTRDTVTEARRRKIPVEVISDSEIEIPA